CAGERGGAGRMLETTVRGHALRPRDQSHFEELRSGPWVLETCVQSVVGLMVNEPMGEREGCVHARLRGRSGNVRIQRSRAGEIDVLFASHREERLYIGPAYLGGDIDRRFFRGLPVDERN